MDRDSGGSLMDRDEVWRAIDGERVSLADLLDSLGDQEWETPSLCAGWRVRDVAAHLTMAHLGVFPVAVAADAWLAAATQASKTIGAVSAMNLLIMTPPPRARARYPAPGSAQPPGMVSSAAAIYDPGC